MPRQSSVRRATDVAFHPCGVVTLTTDFGLRDPFVGIMHGQVLRRHGAARIVDLTHGIAPQAIAEAGFWLSRSFRNFPGGTVHVAVVDPGVGTARGIAIVETAGHVLLAPDNGLLAAIVARSDVESTTTRRLDAQVLPSLEIHALSATFHGRDLFAPLAGELASGRVAPDRLGPVVADLVVGDPHIATATPDGIDGHVVTTDHFGNLLTNVEADALARVIDPRVRIGQVELPLRRTYGDVRPGEYVAVVNSFGVLEVALAAGSAAEALRAGPGTVVAIRPANRC